MWAVGTSFLAFTHQRIVKTYFQVARCTQRGPGDLDRLSLARPFAEINLQDIGVLQANKVTESEVLDYKSAIPDDDELIRHVDAFANAQGGRIICGIRATEKGGYPKDLLGIDNANINRERLEQILLTNIAPRLQTRMKEIPLTADKSFLLIEIPDSALKPHMVIGSGWYQNRYFRRFQLEAQPMTETEISDAYRRKFATFQEVGEYLNYVVGSKYDGLRVFGQFVVIPANLGMVALDTSNKTNFDWARSGGIKLEPNHHESYSYVPGDAQPSADGVLFRADQTNQGPFLQIHRNGCVEYWREYLRPMDCERKAALLPYLDFSRGLMHTLQFASMVFSKVNYFGEVMVTARIIATEDLFLDLFPIPGKYAYRNHTIFVQRQFPSAMLESDFSYIASGMMNEIFNYFGAWSCPLFDRNGKWIPERFRMP